MRFQRSNDIIRFLKDNIEPLTDNSLGIGYRVSVYLIDGTFLPCVIFRNTNTIVNLAIRRFKEEQTGKGIFKKSSGLGYFDIVKNFVANGNCINDFDIDRVEKSKFAFPLKIQNQIRGETTMGWTGFVAKMNDGKHFGFGTTFSYEFFQMPDNYSVDDIVEIINHSYVLRTGELRSHREGPMTRPEEYKEAVVYREKVYFECYVEGL